jgi:hypothetical protein
MMTSEAEQFKGLMERQVDIFNHKNWMSTERCRQMNVTARSIDAEVGPDPGSQRANGQKADGKDAG